MENLTTLVTWLLILVALLAAAVIWLTIVVRGQNSNGGFVAQEAERKLVAEIREELVKSAAQLDQVFRAQSALDREEVKTSSRQVREELISSLGQFGQTISTQLANIANIQNSQIDKFSLQLGQLIASNEQRLEALRNTVDSRIAELIAGNVASHDGQRKLVDEKLQLAVDQARENREESAEALRRFGSSMTEQLTQVGALLKGQLDSQRQQLEQQLQSLTAANDKRLVEMRETVEAKLTQLQADNSQKLEQMRQTVDEKLHNTLEQRLGESFKLVSERLELVHKGLGEMQSIASGVGDLKKVLTNIKTRGIWGEMQLENLLEQMLTPEQYEKNVPTKKGSNDRVEFAIKLPGRDAGGDVVWLPIDAKFPREDYERLVDAQDQGDVLQVEESSKALESRVKNEAKTIRDKYIDPPNTTDFALLFLATEGLYAELIRRPGLQDFLQREYRVLLVGPSNLSALLNSLQMGFRSLAIEKRSSEVWSLLGAVKAEFGKFGDVLEKTRTKLEQASKSIGEAETRSRQIHRKLRGVEALPSPQIVAQLLGDGEDEVSAASTPVAPVDLLQDLEK